MIQIGTRGFIGVLIEDTPKITYNHFDSYPGGLGTEVLSEVRNLIEKDGYDAAIAKLREQAAAVVLVDEGDTPTPEHLEQFAAHADPHVGASMDNEVITQYYQLLRGLQGNLLANLEAGLMIDSADFPLDSLFCEWGYLVNLDEQTLEVYQGFQHQTPTRGFWANRPTAEENKANHEDHVKWCAENGRDPWMSETPEYKAVDRVASFPLNDLPTPEKFLLETEGPAEPEDE